MRSPLSAESPIDGPRYRKWLNRFGSYRSAVTKPTIEEWLEQFHERDRDLAARLLDVVEFYGQAQICAAYRQALQSLPGWHPTQAQRTGKWRFAAMSGSAGESGDGMLYHFRVANNLDGKKHSSLFVGRRDLVAERLGADDTIVLLDDFSGTGRQVCDAWTNPETAFGELLADVGRVYLILVAATKRALDKIGTETSISVVPAHQLSNGDDIFSTKCRHFSANDKKQLESYCRIASSKNPRGFGDCGLVVVFQHRTPNNTIPIFHANHNRWSGLFPRHD